MAGLSEYDIASQRDTSESFMTDTITVERPIETRNPGGGVKKDWDVVLTDVPCDVYSETSRGTEGTAGGRTRTITTWYIAVGVQWDIQLNDRATDQYGRKFTINDVGDPAGTEDSDSSEILLAVTRAA